MRPYLGTSLPPDQYYRARSSSYVNPHAEGIARLLLSFREHVEPPLLDLGCGPGLATKVLGLPSVGVDLEPVMVARYRAETGMLAVCGAFWDPLPPARTAVSTHALHLCPPSRASAVAWRLVEAGVRILIVVSPFKRPLGLDPFFHVVSTASVAMGVKGKALHGFLLRCTPGSLGYGGGHEDETRS